LSCT
jgi:putative transposase